MTFELDHRPYDLAFRRPMNTAHGAWMSRKGILLRVRTAQGGVGYGEIAPIPDFGTESQEAALTLLAKLGPLVDEREADQVPETYPCTRGALRVALEEARGLAPARPAESDYLQVAGLLPAGKAALGALADRLALGFRVFKWKVGVGDWKDELVLLDDLLGGMPHGAQLRLDANGAWDRRIAERWLSTCAGRPIEFVEQPVAAQGRGAEDLLLGLAGDFPVPIALDESAVTDAQLRRWLSAGWPGLYVVKWSLLAEPQLRLEELAKARARLVFSSALETCLGARHALRAAFAWQGERRALGFGVWPLFQDSRLNGPAAAPFIRGQDLQAIDPEAAWNALS
jgi:O-succinylbenzoate synthase